MKRLFSLIAFLIFALLITGCNGLTPINHPENSLNTYNTYWDNFAGTLEKGKIYQYSNSGFSEKLQFKVLQVIAKDAVLVIRHSGHDYVYGEYKKIYDDVIFLIVSGRNYADGAALYDGLYECVGTYQYETKNKFQKTVYAFVERPQSQEKSAPKYIKK